MRLFLGTANIDERRQAARMGVLAGALTNPTLIAKVLTASVRSTLHVIQVAMADSHLAMLPYAELRAMLKHPLTDSGIDERFLADSRKYAAI